MKGAINSLTKEHITGWVILGFRSTPLQVDLFINGKHVETSRADLFRKSISDNQIHYTGNCGFKFNLRRHKIDPHKDKIEVKLSQNVPLNQKLAQKIIDTQRSKLLGERPVYFFVHIPKTAGTSFRNMLYNQFDQSQIFPNMDDIESNNNRYPQFSEIQTRVGSKYQDLGLFCGHYTYNNGLKILGKNMRPIVFFRDPIKRSISLLYQLRRMIPDYKNKSLEYVFEKEPNQVSNVQTFYMTGGAPPIKQTETQLKNALSRLKQLEVFGLAEHFDESVIRMEKQYNWKLGKSKNLNKNPTSKKEISPSLIREIEKVNQYDLHLYQVALEEFQKRS